MNLFAAAEQQNRESAKPLAARMRPAVLSEFCGQEHILGEGRLLRRMLDADRIGSMIFYGPPGTGKTTLAELIAKHTHRQFQRLNATTAGVKDVREVLTAAADNLAADGTRTVLFIDELHRFSRSQQDILLPDVENGTISLIGATTANPFFSLVAPLISRSQVFEFKELSQASLESLMRRALDDARRGLASHKVQVDADALEFLARLSDGDARRALTALEIAVLSVARTTKHVSIAVAEESLQRRVIRFDPNGDDHYDLASAFIKSIRGSDPDAALYWMARMLESGEDPRFIARRLVIAASEDIGIADSTALLVAVAAAHAVEFVGLPEAQLNLSHAVRYLAAAPKNDAAARAIWDARESVRRDGPGEVPMHLRDAHYPGADALGHGAGYVSPHVDPQRASRQSYAPER
jgi:putative ATPase